MRCNDIPALKAAITFANTNGGRITLASHCTYTLTAPDNTDDGLPEITGNVTISGRDTTIRRAPNATQDFRIFHVVSGGNLTLNSLTVSGGRLPLADSMGGGIANTNGTLNLNRSIIKGNRGLAGRRRPQLRRTAQPRPHHGRAQHHDQRGRDRRRRRLQHGQRQDDDEGRVPAQQPVADRQWRRSGEHPRRHCLTWTPYLSGGTPPFWGAASVRRRGASLRLTSSKVSDNIAVSGAGLSNNDATATLIRSLVTHNTAITNGGGIDNEAPSQVTLKASKVIRNAPNNCTPEGSVPGCTNPANTTAPPSSQVPSSNGGGKTRL